MSLCLRSVAVIASGVYSLSYSNFAEEIFIFYLLPGSIFSFCLWHRNRTLLVSVVYFYMYHFRFGGGGQRGGKEAKRVKEKKGKSEREKALFLGSTTSTI